MSEKEKSHVFDQYDGENIVVQLREVFMAVTAPGILGQMQTTVDTPDGPKQSIQPITTQALPGVCKIVKDERGNVRLRLQYNDPNPKSSALVSSDFDPEDIFAISIVKESEKSSIIT